MMFRRVKISLSSMLIMACMASLVAVFQGALAGETVMVPDQFLRRWDPVTLFLDHDRGPAGGGPEDHPESTVHMTPAHPGAYTWLDARTLQFRPAEPWPPLAQFTFKFGGHKRSLYTLMAAPLDTIPARNAEYLDPVESMTLYFQEPLDPATLAKMITIELRPLPGVEHEASQWLDKSHFDVKILERQDRADRAGYVLRFKDPISYGVKALVYLRLSLNDTVDQAFERIVFSTAAPFQVSHLGFAGRLYPLTRQGVTYGRDQAIESPPTNRRIEVRFSARPEVIGPVEARNLVRFSPALENLSFTTAGNALFIDGDFKNNTLYQVRVEPTRIRDQKGRVLQMDGPSSLFVYFPPKPDYLRWDASQGILERYGAQMVPLKGRGYERLDLRIHALDPYDRSFWPFPGRPVEVDENQRPPAPGEEPGPFASTGRYITSRELGRQIKALGSPAISQLVSLPLAKNGPAASFGLDLGPYIEKISGKSAAGAYLVGVRRLDGSHARSYMRVQVTDLCLTTVAQADAVKFAVTSLATGKPVNRARIQVQGRYRVDDRDEWQTFVSGFTDSRGFFTWRAPGRKIWREIAEVRRIAVDKDGDVLVLDPTRAPDRYQDNLWTPENQTWLQWCLDPLEHRAQETQHLCHIFTERPVYRPEEPVHIKGYLRDYRSGAFAVPGDDHGFLVVAGPGDLEWRYKLPITESGSFYHQFDEENLPTGDYTTWFEYDREDALRVGLAAFQKQAYRLPKFEVRLDAPDTVSLDEPFHVNLAALYYAGGRVSDQPVRWRVTQFPYTWTPEKREGYFYATDARFSGDREFRSLPALDRIEKTDDLGGAQIEIDPSLEPTAQPRQYVIEATVTGADDQTVTNTRRVTALPPFVLGVKVPRYIKDAVKIEPEIILAGPAGDLLAGHRIEVRVLQRQWHSVLQAGDFSTGEANYLTEVVDQPVYETEIQSQDAPSRLSIPIDRAGVYIVEVEAADNVGRTQSVRVDLFAGGKEPVTWSRPPSQVFTVTPEKSEYAPGDTAELILESPFQQARALVVVEAPDGVNQYHWLNVRNASAVFRLPIEKADMPKIPVHFLLMRGRIQESPPENANQPDLGKPATLAATAWVKVSTVEHQVKLDLAYPEKARPGQEIEVQIRLSDAKGHALSGEVALWLVDQAVLALGREQRLDPLPDFIPQRYSQLQMHDTRALGFGYLPLQEMPGGDGMAAEKPNILDRVTIRKNFQPVPYYNPDIQIGPDGMATVSIKLPDNLTNFKVRAKAVSGTDRFGYARGHIEVRLPVIVQPSLPRFVRPGDRFTATAIGRIVEGPGGPGTSQIRVEGLWPEGPVQTRFEWLADKPRRIEYPLAVPPDASVAGDEGETQSVTIVLGVERESDQAGDAFSASLPVLPDRDPVRSRLLADLSPGKSMTIPGIDEPARPGTLRRSLLISRRPALVRMAAGLSYLLAYPHGCTEQRLSRARAMIAARKFRNLFSSQNDGDRIAHGVTQALEWITAAVDDAGLVAYWPGGQGYVVLTAWSLQFMTEARDAGFAVPDAPYDTLVRSLTQALRSDYAHLIIGREYAERCWALAALAGAGRLEPGYAAELARKADYLDLESKAQVVRALHVVGAGDSQAAAALAEKMWSGIVFRMYQGREIYGGLQHPPTETGLIIASETRSVAQVLRTAALTGQTGDPRPDMLLKALTTLGQGTGWGTTNANAEALLALSQVLASGDPTAPLLRVRLRSAGDTSYIDLAPGHDLARQGIAHAGEVALAVEPAGHDVPLGVRLETTYLPAAAGSEVTAGAAGFAVSREQLKIKPGNAPAENLGSTEPRKLRELAVGDIIEEHVVVVNPEDRHFVAVVIPLAAGMEPMNPALETAPAEARPDGELTLKPTYTAFMDDHLAYYYDTLEKGTYHFYCRTRAFIPGTYIQPPAKAEMMYDLTKNGWSNGGKIGIGN